MRLSSTGTAAPDAGERFRAALWNIASQSDRLVHAYATNTDGGIVAAVFIHASTLEAAELGTRLLAQDALRAARLNFEVTACGAALLKTINEP